MVFRQIVVELRGFEPLASTMRMLRATNCAIAPYHQLNPFRSANVWYYTKVKIKKQYLKMIFCLKVVAPQCILHRKEKVSGTIIWYCSIVHRPVTA